MTKRAFLLAIDNYHPLMGSLKGCVRDAAGFRQLLIDRFGFISEHILLLTNANATRQAVLENLRFMVKSTSPGDVLVIYYSGHGVRLDTITQDASGKDEAIVAFSSEWDRLLAGRNSTDVLFEGPNQSLQFVRDKELKAVLDSCAEGVNLTLVLDCCYSGDMNRSATSFPKFIEPPEHVKERIKSAAQDYWNSQQLPESNDQANKLSWPKTLYEKVYVGNRFSFVNTTEKSILLAACSEKETALERVIGNERTGVFTHHLLRTLNTPESLTYSEAISSIGNAMRFVPQTPRLACPKPRMSMLVFAAPT